MVKRIANISVWAVLVILPVAVIAYVIHLTAVTQQGQVTVQAKSVPKLHLNARGELVMGNKSHVSYSKSMKGWVDSETLGSNFITVRGWAGDRVSGNPASAVVVLVNGRYAGQGPTGGYRPDVARSFNLNDLDHSGFDITVPHVDLSPDALRTMVVRVYALNASGEAHELEYGKNLPLGHP